MPQSQYRARQVNAKTHEVIDYHHDESLPGKPLYLLIPGGLIALAALGTIILIVYMTWFDGRLSQNVGLVLIAILSPFYVGGVFLFSYGYELYNIPRAIRLTAIIVFLTVAAVVIVAVLAFVLGAGGGKGGSGGSSKDKSFSGGASKPQASPAQSSSRGSNFGNVIMLGGSGGSSTRTVTHEVVKEKTVEVPVAPRAVDCPFCHHSYVPAEQNYACPSCGAPTPKELIDESQEPKAKG
jgi:hypothetical protein